MPDPLSINVQHLKASETVAISNEAKRRKAAGENVLDLGVGEPDFDTPAPAAQAGILAIQKGMTRYPPNVGIADLRAGIAQQLSAMSNGRLVNPDNIIISSGSKQSIFNACFALFGPKDRVLIPSPAWVSYPQIVHLTRAEPVLVPGDPEWARKNDLWIISDEIYRRINYGPGPAPSLLDLPDELLERTVIIYGASKAYAMTGWRIGAALAPPHLTKAMAALQSHTTTGANHPAQWAAAAAFTDEKVDAEVNRMVAAFRRRRDYLVDRFRSEAPGIEFVEPHGAFYFFFRVDGIRDTDPVTGQSFCEQLMKQEGVALVPGAAFADDRWVRLSYAVSDAELERALEKVLRLIHRLESARAA